MKGVSVRMRKHERLTSLCVRERILVRGTGLGMKKESWTMEAALGAVQARGHE